MRSANFTYNLKDDFQLKEGYHFKLTIFNINYIYKPTISRIKMNNLIKKTEKDMNIK